MHSLPTSEPQLVLSTRFEREPAAPSGRRYALEGSARPGDVLVLAARFGRLVDVRA